MFTVLMQLPLLLPEPPGLEAIIVFFGIFVAGGTTPTYTATYYYNGNPNVNAGNENNLLLFNRNNNATTPWANTGATLNTGTKTLTRTGEGARGEYVLGTSGTPLPTRLLYFTAVLTVNQQVLCQWVTATEINNDYFTVEKTQDGINYKSVGNLKGAGNSSMSLYYSMLDESPYSGTSYYRLKQTDYDGQFSYSQLVAVNLKGLEIITMYPNPATTHLFHCYQG